ncbi:hypothetical protein [Streptomyces sp. NBC_01262]|uniref:hypothetical protein n=1 Tax=Streptomyces sp. NBC_01262 TaxID=2903803 RepID=UPI002E2EFDCC|nr:hypothetical protein [Streptomyces sp. NBC_01262]
MNQDGRHGRILVSCLDEDTAKAIEEGLGGSDAVVVRRLPNDGRAIEATVLVAIVSAGSAAATAVLTGVFGVLAQRGGKTVRITGASGREIEVPADTPADRLDDYIAIAQRLDVSSIQIE